jgi:hypothetical protein
LFDDVATQMRWFYVIWFAVEFCDAANYGGLAIADWRVRSRFEQQLKQDFAIGTAFVGGIGDG